MACACVMWFAISDYKKNNSTKESFRVFANVSEETLGIYNVKNLPGMAITDKSELSKTVIDAINDNNLRFRYCDKVYDIVAVIVFAKEYLRIKRKNPSFSQISIDCSYPIYITRKIYCEDTHDIYDVVAYARQKNTTKIKQMKIQFCRQCKQFFVLNKELKPFITSECPIVANFRMASVSSNLSDSEFNESSWLSVCGYKVGTHGLLDEERHKIIKYVIDQGLMTPYEIVNLLYMNIDLREGQYDKDYSKSISDWWNDRDFIVQNYYNIDYKTIIGDLVD